MKKTQMNYFLTAYSHEATPGELSLIGDMMAVWAKLDPTARKNPAIYRRGILFGMALQQAITAGKVMLPEAKTKRQAKTATELQERGGE